MLKQIGLSILILTVGLSSWGQELNRPEPVPSIPVVVPPGNEAQAELPMPPPVSRGGQGAWEAEQLVEGVRGGNSFVLAQNADPVELRPSPDWAQPVEDLEVVTRRLDLPIPVELMEMIGPLLGPGGQYQYEDEIRLLVMRGTEKGINDANDFIDELSHTFELAFHEESEKTQRQPVQIEAVLLIGRKVADQVVPATEAILPFPVPAEIAHMGLGEEDLFPFAFGEVEVVGRAVLHTNLPPSRLRPDPVETYLAGHRIEFSLSHRSGEPAPDYPVLQVTASYESPQAPREVGGGDGMGMTPTSERSGNGGVGATRGRASSGSGAGRRGSQRDDELNFADFTLNLDRESRPRGSRIAMMSEPKAVFDRPILVGSYKPSPDETAILAIRLTEFDE